SSPGLPAASSAPRQVTVNEPTPLLGPVTTSRAGAATPERPSVVWQYGSGCEPAGYTSPSPTPTSVTVGGVVSMLTVRVTVVVLPATSLQVTLTSWSSPSVPSVRGPRSQPAQPECVRGAPASSPSKVSSTGETNHFPAPGVPARRFETWGPVASRLMVTLSLVVPPALVATQVKVTPAVSLVTRASSQPSVAVIRDPTSPTVQRTLTSPVYQPARPSSPCRKASTTGGVVSLGPRRWTNTSKVSLVSPGTRVEARDWNATKRPSALMRPSQLVACTCAPSLATDTRSTCLASRSNTNTSGWRFVSPGTRLVARDSNTTNRPSGLMVGAWLVPSACAPLLETDTRSVVPVARSRTKTSTRPLVSPGTRFVAFE